MERRYEIDWIRNISILMLFVYHTAAIFCVFGDFYIISENKSMFANLLIVLMFVWYMPTLFFLAGASTYFASQKRGFKEYLIERIKKLFIPLLFGVAVLVPPQTYMARVWRGESGLNYIEHLKYFFTNLTDFTGYDGAFSPAHLWFILYLFVVSLIGGFVVFEIFKKDKFVKYINVLKAIIFSKYSFGILVILGIVSDLFPSIMGKSLLGCFLVFMMGYLVYSDTKVLEAIIEKRFKNLTMILISAIIGLLYIFLFKGAISDSFVWIIEAILKNMVLISAISTIVGFASIYLNTNNKLLKYLNASAFPVYIIHQPILLAIAFYIIPIVSSTLLSMVLIIVTSLVASFAVFEVVKRIRFINVFLGIK